MYPVLFRFEAITVYSYGAAVAVSVLAVVFWAYRWAPQAGFSRATAMDALFVLFVSGIVGARAWYVAQHWAYFSDNPISAFSLQEGGLVWYGGFLLALLCGFIFAKIKKLPFLDWADFIAPLLATAHGIGRIGCYFNGCCFGHWMGLPTQLLEAGTLFVLSAALVFFWKRRRFHGQIVWAYAILYSAARFFIEFTREDQSLFHGLSIAQWTSLLIFIIASIAMKRHRHES